MQSLSQIWASQMKLYNFFCLFVFSFCAGLVVKCSHFYLLIELSKTVFQSCGFFYVILCRHCNHQSEHTITVSLSILPEFISVLLLWMQDSDTSEDFTQVPVGVLRVMTEDTPPVINSIAIILEGNIVMDEIPTTCQALCLLFGLIYALHLDYPKGMKNTFAFIQKILLNLGQQKLSPKLQTLKNALSG